VAEVYHNQLLICLNLPFHIYLLLFYIHKGV